MKGDNKIQIPWYRRNIRRQSEEDNTINQSDSDFQRIARGNVPIRQPQLSPNPATQPSTEPISAAQPNLGVVPDIGTNPYRNPAALPTPIPIPQRQPNNQQPQIPTVPLPSYIELNSPYWQSINVDVTKGQMDFIAKVELAATLANISGKKVYDFINNYDYENLKLQDFNRDARDQFGVGAAAVLSALIIGKHLVSIWGRRLGYLVSPPILEDEFIKKYFSDDDLPQA